MEVLQASITYLAIFIQFSILIITEESFVGSPHNWCAYIYQEDFFVTDHYHLYFLKNIKKLNSC